MAEHTRGQDPNQRNTDSQSRKVKDEVPQRSSTEKRTDSSLDEKSSGTGRREKNTGLATKDGLTGSDYDGQVTD